MSRFAGSEYSRFWRLSPITRSKSRPRRSEDGFGNRFDLLDHVVFAIERMLDVVERLGPGRGHHIADEAPEVWVDLRAAATCGGVVVV